MVETTGEEWPWLLIRDEEFNAKGSGLCTVVVVGIGDDDSDGGLAAREVLDLAEHVNYGPAEHLRDGLDALDGEEFVVVVLEAVAERCQTRSSKRSGFPVGGLLPGAFLWRYRLTFDSAEDVVFDREFRLWLLSPRAWSYRGR
jgi:hypothetical protein